MELWVRSQDREMLYKTNELFLDFKICEELGINEYYVNVNHETFGTYKTKERALEVLDEIQKILKPQEYYIETERGTFTKTSDISTYVYEMPED